ncbi:MAG: hypothetical protein ACRDYA_21155 [Egibacteraceae bacterium]
MAAVAPLAPPRPTRPRTASARRPDLRVVAPPSHARRYVVLLAIFAALGVFGVVSLNALAAESAFEARTLEREVRDLLVSYDELTAEVASLEAPNRVGQIAIEELGMVPVGDPGVLAVQGEAPLGESRHGDFIALRDGLRGR